MIDKNDIATRICQYLDTYGISITKFSKTAGHDPSKIIRQLKCKSALSGETINAFLNTYSEDGINLSWLFYGEGPMRIQCPDSPAPVAVRADHVADIDPQPAPVQYFKPSPAPAPTPAPTPAQMNIAEALELIRSQQAIIEQQARMLETLLKNQSK